jgi:hypothetical protein
MSTNYLPKSVFKGTNSNGTSFVAREYDFETFALFEVGGFISGLLVGGLFCAVASPIILVMLMLNFTGRFNFVYLLVIAFSSYFIYDCANAWLFSAFLNIFIGAEGLVFLTCINIACIVVIVVLTLFGRSTVSLVNSISADVTTRYIAFFILVGILFCVSYSLASDEINADWLGLTKEMELIRQNNQ